MRYDLLGVWTTTSVAELEEALHRELGGEFVVYPNGKRSILFGDAPGEVKVRLASTAVAEPDFPPLVLHIDDRDENRSIDVQHRVALEVFEAMTRVVGDRIELWAEDDAVIRRRL